MRSLKGRSGVVHTFSSVTSDPGGNKVTQSFSQEPTEVDIIATFAKALDVGACSVEIVAPSCGAKERKLAESYGMTLNLGNAKDCAPTESR